MSEEQDIPQKNSNGQVDSLPHRSKEKSLERANVANEQAVSNRALNPHLIYKDKESIQSFMSHLYSSKAINDFSKGWNKDLINGGAQLLKQLKKEYDLENE